MPPSLEQSATLQHFGDKLEEIRTICRLHAYPTGSWENLVDLPFRLSQDSGLRADIADIVRALQRNGLHLPDALDLLVIAVGGDSAPRHTRQLADQLSLLGGFLANIGRWPGAESEPILAPGEIPANIQKFTRPQASNAASSAPRRPVNSMPEPASVIPITSNSAQPSTLSPAPATRPASAPATPSSPAPFAPRASAPPAPQSTNPKDVSKDDPKGSKDQPRFAIFTTLPARPVAPQQPAVSTSKDPAEDALPAADISRALARLERGNLELRAHLESIDQRISRMEPLLEVEAANAEPSPHDPAPPQARRFDPLAPSFPTQLNSDHVDSGHPGAARGPVAVPTELPVLTEAPKRAESPAAAQALASPPVPNVVTPRFSRFSRDPGPAEPAVDNLEQQRAADPGPVERKPSALPHGFFGTVPQPDFQSDRHSDLHIAPILVGDPDTPSRSGRRLALIVSILFLLGLALAAALFLRNNGNNADQSSATGINSLPAPRPSIPRPSAARPADSSVSPNGPLTSTPTRAQNTKAPNPKAAKVLGARSALQPTQSIEEPHTQSGGGFRPAGTFVPASVMDGRLISAPLPQQPRVPVSSGLRGMVILEANISSSGQVEDVNILGGNAALRPAAIEAVRNWRYRPYVLNGTPVEVRTIVRVDFNERKSQPAVPSTPFPQ